ncbi:hypothetical protein FOCC_FOCC001961 [Frankliniella occidentalis]|nr:hypothetical protein FOCC_FOCC001961 [Frankliniella occidentalis]
MSAVVKSQPALLHRERYQCYQWQLDITRNPASKALRHGPTRDNYVSNSQSASNWWHCTQEIRYDARPSKSKSSEKPTSVGYRMVGGADVVDADGFMDVEIKSIKMVQYYFKQNVVWEEE